VSDSSKINGGFWATMSVGKQLSFLEFYNSITELTCDIMAGWTGAIICIRK